MIVSLSLYTSLSFAIFLSSSIYHYRCLNLVITSSFYLFHRKSLSLSSSPALHHPEPLSSPAPYYPCARPPLLHVNAGHARASGGLRRWGRLSLNDRRRRHQRRWRRDRPSKAESRQSQEGFEDLGKQHIAQRSGRGEGREKW